MAYRNGNRPYFNNGRRFDKYYRTFNRGNNHFNNHHEDDEKELRYPGLSRFVQDLDPHLVRVVRILQMNPDIRRYTALGIVKRLIAQKVITEEGNYVDFKWNKYTICSKGINQDYRYTEQVFLQSFVGAFKVLSTVASRALDNFCKIEFDKFAGEAIKHDKEDKVSDEIAERQNELDENIANFNKE